MVEAPGIEPAAVPFPDPQKPSYAIVGPHTKRTFAGCHRRGEDQQTLAARPPLQDYLSPGMAQHLTTDRKMRLERRSHRRLLVMLRVVTTHTCEGGGGSGDVSRNRLGR